MSAAREKFEAQQAEIEKQKRGEVSEPEPEKGEPEAKPQAPRKPRSKS